MAKKAKAAGKEKPVESKKPAKAAAPEKKKGGGAFNAPIKPDEVLAKIIGPAARSRGDITKALWDAIKKKDAGGAFQRGREIHANGSAKWLAFFGTEVITMFQMAKCVSQHVTK